VVGAALAVGWRAALGGIATTCASYTVQWSCGCVCSAVNRGEQTFAADYQTL
jgi:hypothetical protein